MEQGVSTDSFRFPWMIQHFQGEFNVGKCCHFPFSEDVVPEAKTTYVTQENLSLPFCVRPGFPGWAWPLTWIFG